MVSSRIISFSLLSSPLLYLTFCPRARSADKVNPAAKEVTVNLLVRGFWGCAMLLHIVITRSDWT